MGRAGQMNPFLPEHLLAGVEVRGIRTQPTMRNPDDLWPSKCVLTESSLVFPKYLGGRQATLNTSHSLSLSLKEGD